MLSPIWNMGGPHLCECNAVEHMIWTWCKDKKMRFTVVLIPGKLSVEADVMSRKFNDCTEWKLDKKKNPKRDRYIW